MAVLLVVQGDAVKGTDKHNVTGSGTIPSPPGTAVYSGVADFKYTGAMREGLSDFVRIDGVAVAVTDSRSKLDPGEDAQPTGGHSGPKGANFAPPTPTPIPSTISILDLVGTGTPSASAGSGFVAIGGSPVLLDGDAIDTCDGLGAPGNSTVTASTQDFVSASE
jgi:hypothetical protein